GTGAQAPRAFLLQESNPPTGFLSTNPKVLNFVVKVYNFSPDLPAIDLGPGATAGLTSIPYGSASNYIVLSTLSDQDSDGNPIGSARPALLIRDSQTQEILVTPTL